MGGESTTTVTVQEETRPVHHGEGRIKIHCGTTV